MNRSSNKRVHAKCGVAVSMIRVIKTIIRSVGHMQKLEDKRINKRVYNIDLEGNNAREA